MDQERRNFLQGSARLGGFALAGAALWRIEPVLAQSGPGHELATMTIVEPAWITRRSASFLAA